MKVYVQSERVVIQGKSWQVLYLLKKYSKQFKTVSEWTEAMQQQK